MIKSFTKSLLQASSTLLRKQGSLPKNLLRSNAFHANKLSSSVLFRFNTTNEDLKPKGDVARGQATLQGLLKEGKNAMLKGDYAEAEEAFENALTFSVNLYGESGQYVGVCYSSLGNISILKGDKRKGREYYLKAYDILDQDRDKHKPYLLNIERALNSLGVDNKFKEKNIDATKQKFEEELAQLLKDGANPEHALKIGNIYNSLGSLSRQVGEIEEAIEFKQKALEFVQKHHSRDVSSMFLAYLDLAMFYWEIRYYNEAIEYIEVALKTIENQKSDKAEALRFIGLHNLGKVHVFKKDYNKALGPLIEALQIKEFSQIRDEPMLKIMYHEVGMCYYFLEEGKEAIRYFEKALDLQHKAGDESFVAQLYQHIAECHMFLLGDAPTCKRYLERALTLRKTYQGKDHKDTKALEKILKSMSESE